ncbi:Bifunctional ligase/repressor BirA [Candidatus Fokinia cryptica]|uniref:Bifunctional ligase/repressor BirA n=1 Tax=Candidatus Fokinia crypta TaxID=1920990 RepID=A0ABZ0UNR7_9RICK|nr:Bifunctional ligase/repressor BirA [Candidatus Fokinia cryptica]
MSDHHSGFRVFRLKTVDSTQLYARKLISLMGVTDEFAVSANIQTNGIGSMNRSWVGGIGNLFMTVAFHLDVDVDDSIPQFSYIGATAIGEALVQECNLQHTRLSYKWVNDVLLNHKKCSGVLCEIHQNKFLLIGIGVNIKNFPKLDELRNKEYAPYEATSIENEGLQVSKRVLEKEILCKLRQKYEQWRRFGFESIRKLWMQRAEYLGEHILWSNGLGITKIGKFLGINMDGEMLLLIEDTQEKKHVTLKLRTGSIRTLL